MQRPQYAKALAAAAACLGVLAHGSGDADAAAAVGRRRLQDSADVEITSLGCFRDSKTDRVFSTSLKGQANMTPEVCAAYCFDAGKYKFYALQYGQECWCSEAGTAYDRLGSLATTECDYPCAGDASQDCGGFNAFQAFEYGALDQPAGHLGCYEDGKDRVFSSARTSSGDNTAESCKATCSTGAYAFYGVQWGQECFCGLAGEDYTIYGQSDACGYRCTGDERYTCGGFFAMDVFSVDETVTPAPVTPAPATVAPVTTAPATTAPATPAPATTAPVTPAPATTAPVTPSPATTAPVTPAPATTAPVTPAPATTAPVTPAPATTAPVTPAPATIAPVTPAPVTTAPVTTAPVTTAPVTPAPSTAAPVTPAPVETGNVLVDLVPCLFGDSSVAETNDPALYVMSLFFKGYWAPKTEEFVVSTTDDLSALLIDTTDSVPHGKCNAVYVGYAPSDDQVAALTAYSAQFKVRIVYFPSALTHSTESFTTKLGIQTYFADPIQFPAFIQLSEVGATKVSITQPGLQTDPNTFEPALFSYPVLLLNGVDVAEVEVLAEYADDSGTPIIAGFSSDQENAAMLSYTGADGSEELHVFFTIGWFDSGAWPWAHYFNEWATKGIFMGERRFYLGAVVDDLFLATPEFEYNGAMNEAEDAQRCTADDLSSLLSVQDSLNAQYPGSSIITEFAFNGGGIAEQVSQSVDDITYVPDYEETDVTTKGTKWFENGQGTVHDINWLATNVPLMQEHMTDGTWEANDELLAQVISYLDTPDTFYHGHHTLIHLSRDQLRETDCYTEDTGNVQIALMTGMWDSDNYNWRSMVSPGITGLFNEFCLQSAADNLMTCYPGDNTFDGTTNGAAVLVNEDNQFHSIYTTVSNNGYDGAQIVPRFATYVYFNCVTGDCLVKENEYIRRFVCDCLPLDPDIDDYTCTSTEDECVDDDGNTEIQSFGSTEALFEAEAATTTRYMLTGRRDKYMFHQANIIPAGDVGDGTQSLLDYWYEQVMDRFSSFVTFPVKTIKFDDLCTEFQLHEALDASNPYVTMALDEAGDVTGLTYVSGSGAGLVPLTVPTASAASIPISGLSVQETETYGTDTTYYLKDDDASTVPRVGTKPSAGDLAVVPALVSNSASANLMVEEDPAEAEEKALETAQAQEDNALVGAEGGGGLLGDDGLVEAEVAAEVAVEEGADGTATP